MKKLIFSLVLMSAVNSFAMGVEKDKYCLDESRQVLYVKLDIDQNDKSFERTQVSKAELVVNLGDGTSVIVPCFNDRVMSKVGKRIISEIIPQENIFEIIKNPAKTRFRGIGLNLQNATVLVEENSFGFVKNFSVHKSEHLENLKAKKIKQSIDNR